MSAPTPGPSPRNASPPTARRRGWTWLLWLGLWLGGWTGCRQDPPPPAASSPAASPPDATPRYTAPPARFHSRAPEFTNWWHDWQRAQLVGGYQRFGRTNAAWDAHVLAALEAYAQARVFGRTPTNQPPDVLPTQLKEALQRGCDDPFIAYLDARLVTRPLSLADRAMARDYGHWAEAMDRTGYAAPLKYLVNLRAAHAFRAAAAEPPVEAGHFLRVAAGHLLRALREEELPSLAAYPLCLEYLDAVAVLPRARQAFVREAEPILFARWPTEAWPHAWQGRVRVLEGWELRGSGPPGAVPQEVRSAVAARFAAAAEALDRAWELDPLLPETPLVALQLELGRGDDRARMERWYARAVAFPAHRLPAIRWKLTYLEPRWHGSESACLEAARAIARAEDFPPEAALALHRVHESLARSLGPTRASYWTEPQVWPDLELAFERYFARGGTEDEARQAYALCAYRCERWEVMLAQLQALKRINYAAFGGQEAFEQMRRRAEAGRNEARRDAPQPSPP